MPAHRKGTPGYEESRAKLRKTLIEKYGSEEEMKKFFREIGAKGGHNGHTGGFAANAELARTAGSKGGMISRRGHKLIDEDEKALHYKNLKTGEIIEVLKEVSLNDNDK